MDPTVTTTTRRIPLPAVRTRIYGQPATWLATAIPLCLICTRFFIHTGLWYNDFAIIVLAFIAQASSPKRSLNPFCKLMLVMCGYITLHSAYYFVQQPEFRQSLLNTLLRFYACAFCAIAFSAYYATLNHRAITRGLRIAGTVLVLSILVHFAQLNLLGSGGRRWAMINDWEQITLTNDLSALHFGRPFGLAAEPAFAAGYLFLIGVTLLLLHRDGSPYFQFFLQGTALLTGAVSNLMFLPIWIFLQLATGRNRRIVQAWGVAVFVGLAILVLSAEISGYTLARVDRVLIGKDRSAQARTVPMARTIVGVLDQAPGLGFGIGQARLADRAGYNVLASYASTVEPERYSGVAPIEMLGDFGLPGLAMFFLMLYYGAMSATWRRLGLFWALAILVASNTYLYRNSQLYFWCAMGAVIARYSTRLPLCGSTRPRFYVAQHH